MARVFVFRAVDLRNNPPTPVMSANLPPFFALKDVLCSEYEAPQYLWAQRIFYPSRVCACGREMPLNLERRYFRCGAKGCRKERSIMRGSFFDKCKFPLNVIMHLGYIWPCRGSVNFALSYLKLESEAVCSYYRYFRQLVSESFGEEDCKIGGPMQ